jgi:OmpA-OmpF porin, OOP family
MKACRVIFIITSFLSCLSAPFIYSQDEEGCRDHRLLNRMQNFDIQECEEKDFDEYSLMLASGDEITVEGKKTFLSYVIKEGAKAPSDLQIIRNFENALHESGAKTEYKGTYDLYMSLKKEANELWVHIHTWNDGEGYNLTIIEKQAMEQEITAGHMLDALNKDGFIALYINFDTNKATIKPESMPIIEQITLLLNENKQLKICIEGHTDSTGTPERNKTLSEERTGAVIEALVSLGIDKTRLSSVGWGQEKPVADNSTEEGMAKNRRVDIVKK